MEPRNHTLQIFLVFSISASPYILSASSSAGVLETLGKGFNGGIQFRAAVPRFLTLCIKSGCGSPHLLQKEDSLRDSQCQMSV